LGIIPKLPRGARRRLQRRYRRERSGLVRVRLLIVCRLAEGESSVTIERSQLCVRSTVSYVARRFRAFGELGLEDDRRFNGETKRRDDVVERLSELVRGVPRAFGWMRTTWTRELLARQLRRDTQTRVSTSTVGRWLKRMGARWGRPKLFVLCPWSRSQRRSRLTGIRSLLRRLPADEVALYEDEVDIHLNPRSGPDWMLHGIQKWVRTPGKNVKRYLAGALNRATGMLVWVTGKNKRSEMFIRLLKKLAVRYRRYRRIHVILDNYSIHTSRKTREAIAGLEGQIVLHFLPPFSPEENHIENVWRLLHAGVTRNHMCDGIRELMIEVHRFLRRVQPYPGSQASLGRA
jgi:transposase